MKTIFASLAAMLTVAVVADTVQAFGRGAAVHGAAVGPGGGVRTGSAMGGVSYGPFGGTNAGGVRTGTVTTPGGTTVQRASGAAVSRGPLGGVQAGGGSATRVTTPGGKTYTTGNVGGAAIGPAGGARVGGASGAAVRGPYGNSAAVGQRGGVAVGPYGGVRAGGASAAAVRTPFGGAAVGQRGGVAISPRGAAVGGASFGAVGHHTAYYNPVAVRSSAAVVRANRYSYFTPTWYRGHANAWIAPRYRVGWNAWRPPVWTSVAPFVGINSVPLNYDYGSTVVYSDNQVFIEGQDAGTAADYATQAGQIVDLGRTKPVAENDEWQPLGVVGIVQPDDKVAQRIFQLAINKDGIIRGNYYDAVTDNTLPVVGSVDKQTQRAAWSVGDKKEIVFETGLANFVLEQSTVLIHYGTERTQQMVMVRLEEPQDGKGE